MHRVLTARETEVGPLRRSSSRRRLHQRCRALCPPAALTGPYASCSPGFPAAPAKVRWGTSSCTSGGEQARAAHARRTSDTGRRQSDGGAQDAFRGRSRSHHGPTDLFSWAPCFPPSLVTPPAFRQLREPYCPSQLSAPSRPTSASPQPRCSAAGFATGRHTFTCQPRAFLGVIPVCALLCLASIRRARPTFSRGSTALAASVPSSALTWARVVLAGSSNFSSATPCLAQQLMRFCPRPRPPRMFNRRPRFSLAAAAAASCLLYFEVIRYREFVEPFALFSEKAGTNVFARIAPRSGKADRRLVVRACGRLGSERGVLVTHLIDRLVDCWFPLPGFP